jgi:hypothetical protein
MSELVKVKPAMLGAPFFERFLKQQADARRRFIGVTVRQIFQMLPVR